MGDNNPRDRAIPAEKSPMGSASKADFFTSILAGQSLTLALVVANRKWPLEESTGEISFTVGSTSSMTLPEHRHEYDYDEKLTCKMTDSTATEWTDERHILYLNSIEASFVKKLYNSEDGSNGLLGWLSRTQIHSNSSESDPKNHSFGQFKISRRGCWGEPKFERAKNQAENENKSHRLSENHWIQHFRSHSTTKEPHLIATDQMADNLVGQSVHLINRRHGREATTSRQLPPSSFCPQKIHKLSVGSITEVSDQNFVDVDVEVEKGEESSRRCSKKRARSVASPITDQVVPFAAPASDEKTALLTENNEECSEKNLDDTGDSLQMSHSLLFKDQQLNDPKSEGG